MRKRREEDGGWRKKVREGKKRKREREGKEKKKEETNERCRQVTPEGDRDELWKAMDQWKLIRVSVHRKNQPTHTQSLIR